jgi:hypothetical protein
MKTLLHLAPVLLATLALVACGGDDTSGGGATPDAGGKDTGSADTSTPPADSGTDTSTPQDSGGDSGPTFPAAPALGAQIDRMGRPAINTATNHAFDPSDTTKNAAKDAYNQADSSKWSTYVAEMEKNLAILDSLDTNCGNQLFADKNKTDATRYGTLATVLADDRLWVKTDAAACTTYLAVEANATGIIPNADCGGRVPSYDTLNITYSALAVGNVTTPALDGITDVPARSKTATFPYVAPAN